jgi:hypothetical protein
MENYTNSKMTDVVPTLLRKCRWCCLKGISFVMFPARSVPHSQTFLAVVQRLRGNGTFRSRSVDRCQERTRWVLDFEPQILETVEENPSTSTRQVNSWISGFQFMVCCTLKEQGLLRYHVQRVQALHSAARILWVGDSTVRRSTWFFTNSFLCRWNAFYT